jgi:hypothetical protein
MGRRQTEFGLRRIAYNFLTNKRKLAAERISNGGE